MRFLINLLQKHKFLFLKANKNALGYPKAFFRIQTIFPAYLQIKEPDYTSSLQILFTTPGPS